MASLATGLGEVGDFVVFESGAGQRVMCEKELALIPIFMLFDGYAACDPPSKRRVRLNREAVERNVLRFQQQ